LVSIDFASGLEGLIDYKAELYKRKSDCLITLNKLAQARVSLEKANDIFKKIPELTGTRWQIETLKIGAELAKAEGNYEIAYQLFNQFHYDEVDMLRRNMTDRLLRVRGTLESERQNVEISLLKQRAKVQKLQFEQQKQDNTIQSYIIGLIVLFIFFMLFFAYFQWSHNKKLTLLSIRDPLSNSFNRRYVFNFLHKLVSANHSDRNTISIMVIDIDDFKKVNDVYGHPFGDEVIRKIAEIGSEVLRTEDVIGRVGGEEFLCVLPRIDAVQSLHIAQRFVNRVNAYDFFSEDEEEKIQKVNVTVSIGLATTSKHIQSSSELYVQADKALYHAKYNGKNRAIQYQDAMQYSNQQKANFSHATSILDDE
jgi:diguanylate cyclase (GGDEF)-like protein